MPGAIGQYGFSYLATTGLSGQPYVNNGAAYYVGTEGAYWSGRSWNGLSVIGTRKVTNPVRPLFPDLPDVQRIMVGFCLWWTGDHFALGVQLSQFDYEGANEVTGIVYPNMDWYPGYFTSSL